MGSLGYTRVLASWRRPYKTKDGYLCMMAYTQEHWRKFWIMVGKSELHDDPRFDCIASRARNIVRALRAGRRLHRGQNHRRMACAVARTRNPVGARVEPRRGHGRSAA
jgi:crotonobetainyl-CoA:carnitine CoA-transferase CaiB-like acyl-CoA transferase